MSTYDRTVLVSRAQLDRLKEHWATFLAVSDHRNNNFDPVVSLRCTGALIAAVDRVIATAEDPEPPLNGKVGP